MTLPFQILRAFREQSGSLMPAASLRVYRTVDGLAGEGWLASWSDGIVHISRSPEAGLRKQRYHRKNIRGLTIDDGQPVAPSLVLRTEDGSVSFPFGCGSRDMKSARLLAGGFSSADPVETPPPLPGTVPPPLPLRDHGLISVASELESVFRPQVVYFCAMLLLSVARSGRGSQAQYQMIGRIFEDHECIAQARRLIGKVSEDDIMLSVERNFTEAQKQCLVSNMLDIMTVDGNFTRAEQAFADRFRSLLGMPESTWDSLKGFIMAKNNYAVFQY